jgi:hypothetical protein
MEGDPRAGPIAIAFAPDGTLHVLCELFYNAHRYREPDENDLNGHYMTRFDPGLGAPKVTVVREITSALEEGSYDSLVDLALVRDGVLFMSRAGRSWVTDHDGAIRRAFAVDDWDNKPRMYRENLACRASVRPDGRLVIAVAEADSNMAGNLIAVSVDSHPDLAAGPLAFRYQTSMKNLEVGEDEIDAEIPYVRLADGTPLVRTNRPTPTLEDAPDAPLGASLEGLAAVTNQITLVALFLTRYTKHSAFRYALIDDAGEFVASLDLDGDSPYEDRQFGIAGDSCHGRVIIKTKARIHVFDDRGRVLARVSLADVVVKALAAFHLLGASPAGEILLHHKTHRTLLLVDATPNIDEFPAALAAAAAHYKVALAAAKKVHNPVNSRWVVDA